MIHPVYGLDSACLGSFTLLDKGLQVVERLGHDREVTVLEEKRNDTFLHVGSLGSSLLFKIILDELW